METVQDLQTEIAKMNRTFYALHGELAQISPQQEQLEQQITCYEIYQKNRPLHTQKQKLSGRKRRKFEVQHQSELAQYDKVVAQLHAYEKQGIAITYKAWKSQNTALQAQISEN